METVDWGDPQYTRGVSQEKQANFIISPANERLTVVLSIIMTLCVIIQRQSFISFMSGREDFITNQYRLSVKGGVVFVYAFSAV